MNIIRTVLSTLLVGQLLHATDSVIADVGLGNKYKKIVWLDEQIEYFCNKLVKDKNGYECPSYELVRIFKRDTIITIEYFEFSVYSKLEQARSMDFDGFTAYLRLRGYIKSFLIFLENFGSQLKDHHMLIHDTSTFSWSHYKTINGNYDFKSDNKEEFDKITDDIINSTDQISKCVLPK